MFSGEIGGGRAVSMAGSGRGRQRPGNESRQEFMRRQQKEREERELKRLREKSSGIIQRMYRGWKSRQLAANAHRLVFDKRCSDIAKVETLLPADKRADFVYRALLPLLRPLAVFFNSTQDRGRLAKVLAMVHFSAEQPAQRNFFYLALIAEESQRRTFLFITERLTTAMLRCGELQELVHFLLAFHTVVFSSLLSAQAAELRAEAVAHLLRRTSMLSGLMREAWLLDAPAASAAGAASVSQLPDVEARLAELCCAGLDAPRLPALLRRSLAVRLLSSPLLWVRVAGRPGPPHSCMRQVAGALAGGAADPEESRDLVVLLSDSVREKRLRRWFLGSLAAICEKLLVGEAAEDAAAGSNAACAVSLLPWVCWARSPAGAPDASLAALPAPFLSPALARALVRQDGQYDVAQIISLYFPPGADVAAEALQTLAFSTPLAGMLLPPLLGLARSSSMQAAFLELGAREHTFDTPVASRLRAFCLVYTMRLQSMYDAEFFGAGNPLRPKDVTLLVPFLNRLAYCFATQWPQKDNLAPAGRGLRSSVAGLVRALYHRHLRRSIFEEVVSLGVNSNSGSSELWLIPEATRLLESAPIVDLGTDDMAADPPEQAEDDDGMDVDEEAAGAASANRRAQAAAANVRKAARLGGDSNAREALEAVLDEIPHVLPFQDRVVLLHNVILVDQDNREDTRAPWARSALPGHQIRRTSLFEDGFAAFSRLEDEDALRSIFKVEFLAPDGTPEQGIDGGGLFKEFMVHICREAFDPLFGLFAATTDQSVYPAPTAFRAHRNAAELYRFLGKVVGKAIYEMMLLEPQFSRVFLNRLLGHTNEVDDVAALDQELYRGMLRLKDLDRIEDLDLTFSISTSQSEDVDLVPNGSKIPVTRDNLTQYLHVVANFRTNLQMQRHTAAFVQGLQCVIPLSWLKMFDPYELNMLVSGSSQGFDVADLRNNTVYSGGYHENHEVVHWFWELLFAHLDVEDMGRLLMFATSCSRPPLLGFKTLQPKFCIHRVPDASRLPTASTCANLLKLPAYTSYEVLKDKLTEAIRSECGFDLS